MTAVLVLLGGVLVAVAVVDAVVTTLAAGSGGGPLTRRLSSGVWRALRRVARGRAAGLLPWSGVVVLLVTVLTWVLLMWAGWTIVFSSTPSAVVTAQASLPADVAARIYYAGFVVFTLGVGDVVAGGPAWQLATAVATFIGLAVVTLSITYLVSVVNAAVSRRALARTIHLSGLTGADIVSLHWHDGRVRDSFGDLVESLCTQILQITQQHLAYPVLHHFHAAEPESSAPRALAALDDALVLLGAALPEERRPPHDTLTRLRRALEHYAGTVHGAAGKGAQAPPLPDLDALRTVGIPVVSDIEFARSASTHQRRRQELAELVRADAWSWPATG